MTDIATIEIELDESVKSNPFFSKPKKLKISVPHIFKYGIYMEPVPEWICDSDFKYIEGKVPHLIGLNGDWIALDSHKVLNRASGEKATDISELIGVGIGLYYLSRLLRSNSNRIRQIPPPNERKKILDFAVFNKQQLFEIETKGTAYRRNVGGMKKDIDKKKKDNNNSSVKIGTVALARKEGAKGRSKLFVMDDFDEEFSEGVATIRSFFYNYLSVLSLILDSKYFNLLRKQLQTPSFFWMFDQSKIPSRYELNDVVYLGQYFDRRLRLDTVNAFAHSYRSIDALFKAITREVGREKYFIGIDEEVIKMLNEQKVEALMQLDNSMQLEQRKDVFSFVDTDGVLILRSRNSADKQIERNFPEKAVRKRLSFVSDYARGVSHLCGAPCTGWEKEGEPCKNRTYREHCHHHR